MEENIKIMIERFFNAELSAKEERELCCFLREHNVPAELRKDKECIIALCGKDEDIASIPGAEARLEAMLDTLAEDEERQVTDGHSIPKAKRRILKVPRLVWYSAAAAVVLAASLLFMDSDGQHPAQHTGQAAKIVQITVSEPELDEPEEDTFDNPEDAMKCFKAAMGDIKLALNTTEKNTREISDALNEAIMPYKNIIRINM